MARLFDRIVMVDWSAASRPRLGRDSIWLARLDAVSGVVEAQNCATRKAAEQLIVEFLEDAQSAEHRLLLGFDFPFGYAGGLALRLGLSIRNEVGQASLREFHQGRGACLAGSAWRAIWQEYEKLIEDDENNRNNRFCVANELNRRISDGHFPFWGRPAGQNGHWPYLAARHHYRHEQEGLAERRQVDRLVPSAQPGWKLYGNGSAGSQALTGIPVLERLKRRFPALQIWPFETGLAPPDLAAAGAVLVEIYPSLFLRSCGDGQVKDEAQMRATVAHFADLDRRGALGRLFCGDPKLTAEQRRIATMEEGWVLGVTGPVSARGKARAVDG
jgi:precorrin-8X/cobalt-precorrin-8 methylmutase